MGFKVLMYSRKKSREIALRTIFGLSAGGIDGESVASLDNEKFANILELACDGEELPTGRELEYIKNLYGAVCGNLAAIDKIIADNAKGFSPDRIFKTDLAALRLGIAEIKYTDVQPNIAINEAVEIAKKYGTEKSAAFINGILAKVTRD